MGPEAEHFINLLSPYIHAYGYWVAFFGIMLENAGIPVPAETTLVILSFFASQGALKIWLVIPIAILGDTVGDNIGFFIGRTGGRRVLEKLGPFFRIDKARLEAMEALFREKGARTVFTAHFFSTTRFAAAFAAGVSQMPYPRFLAVNVAAAAVFVTMVAGATYYFGANLDSTLRFFHLFRLAGLVVAVLLATAFLYHFYLRKKHLYRRLGLKIISASIAASIIFGLAVYTVSGALIVLPHTGKYAGQKEGMADGIDVGVERGFISNIDGRNVLVTALGEPVITLAGKGKVNLTVRNIRAYETTAKVSSGVLEERPIALDSLTLNFIVEAREKTVVRLSPKKAYRSFGWAAAGDTRDWGPVLNALVASLNEKGPAFAIHAGDFVEDGERRKYRAFLDRVGGLALPLYTCPGAREMSDRGEKVYGELFGPANYSFDYRGSTFIVLDTTKLISGAGFAWLEEELKKAQGGNIFVITYHAPADDPVFAGLLSRYGVKAVYSIKGGGADTAGKVRYISLAHVPGKGYSYILTRVDGKEASFEEVAVVPKGLTAIDRLVLAYEDLLRRIAGYVD
jgi:membrane protein DedA with SNARE-associated domain